MNLLAIDMANLPLPAIAVSIFAVAFILYIYIAKAIGSKNEVAEEKPAAPAVQAAAPAVVYTGPELIGVEEREAAVVMAIVSHKTGIPLNRLKFESIRLTEDK